MGTAMVTVMPSFMTPALTTNFTGFLASVHPMSGWGQRFTMVSSML